MKNKTIILILISLFISFYQASVDEKENEVTQTEELKMESLKSDFSNKFKDKDDKTKFIKAKGLR